MNNIIVLGDNILNMYLHLKGLLAINVVHRNWKNELNRNKELKGIGNGKRCFILGNGPSLNSIDFELLKNEVVFTVNQISRNENFNKLKSNYHFWLDSNFFKTDEKGQIDKELLLSMKKVGENNEKIKCFFPIQHKEFVEKQQLNEKFDCHYFYPKLKFTHNYRGNVSFVGPVPTFGTVVQECILMAIYMGFEQIILLGCDNTSILGMINAYADSFDENIYAYNVSENEKKRMTDSYRSIPLSKYVLAYYNNLMEYTYLYEFCLKRNINLINCSSKTTIDGIPRKRFEEIL